MKDEAKHLARMLMVAEQKIERLSGDLAVALANWDAAQALVARLRKESRAARPVFELRPTADGYRRELVSSAAREVDEATLKALCELLGIGADERP